MAEESLWSKPKKKRVRRKVPKEDLPSTHIENIEQLKRVEAEVMVAKEDEPKPKSVVPANLGPEKRGGDTWLENTGKRTFMFRGHNCKPGTGCWVSDKARIGLERFIDASKKSPS